MNRILFSTLGGGLALLLSLGVAPQTTVVDPAEEFISGARYTVDPVHSSIVFKIGHLGVANFYGRFNEISGVYVFDPESPDSAGFDLQVKAASVDTNNDKRDNHLRSPDFFNAVEFPEIRFKSTKVTKTSDSTYRVTGDLGLHGVSKPITVDLTFTGAKETGMQGYKSGFETTFTIKRTDFEMDTYVAEGALGDEVQLTVSLEGRRK